MDRRQTAQVLSILKAAYPNFYRGMGKADLEQILSLWTDMFQDDDPRIVAGAVKAFIASDSKGFPPVIGTIKEKVRQITKPPMMTEQEAWSLVLDAMNCSEHDVGKKFEALPPVVRSIVGNARQLWDWGMMDSQTVNSVVASNFMRSYRNRAQQQADFEALPGDVQRFAIEAGAVLSLDEAIGKTQTVSEIRKSVAEYR